MTLGDYLDRRTLRITVFVGVIALTAWGVMEWVYGFEGLSFGTVIMVLFATFIGAGNGARCPRCGAALYGIREGPRNRHGEAIPVGSDCCNQCGLHCKEELRPTDRVDTWL